MRVFVYVKEKERGGRGGGLLYRQRYLEIFDHGPFFQLDLASLLYYLDKQIIFSNH